MKIKNAFSRIMLLVMATAVMGVMSVHGVDGLQIQVQQNTNIMLRWPSNPGQTYLILYTKSLNAPIQWTVLEQAYPAAEGTNETTFI
ncbi:MAG TPA: hypothetical protein VFM25_10065, partial [Verrucomicrobiae bacterium]|nr:hypothetical protein [Verrucomicrobiae bacterium]